MARYISILRGINVGGRRKILMADLKLLYEELGFSNITTYIQSGNVAFDFPKTESQEKLSRKIKAAIDKTYGFDVPVITRTTQEIEQTIAINPFLKETADIKGLFLAFLTEEPSEENLGKLNGIEFPNDAFEVIGKNVYICCSGRFSDSKLTNNFFENKLKVAATTRNWKTVMKLQEMGVKN